MHVCECSVYIIQRSRVRGWSPWLARAVAAAAAMPPLPRSLELRATTDACACGVGSGWYMIVTFFDGGMVRI